MSMCVCVCDCVYVQTQTHTLIEGSCVDAHTRSNKQVTE